MPLPGFTPYIYKSGDDPVKLAQQNGIPTQTLLNANLGGTPFSTGQNINIPLNNMPTQGLGLPLRTPTYNTNYSGYSSSQAALTSIPQSTFGFSGYPGVSPLGVGTASQQASQASQGILRGQSRGEEISFRYQQAATNQLLQTFRSGQLPTNLTVQQIQQAKDAGMDVSAIAQYYTMGEDGTFQINDAGKAASGPSTQQYGASDPNAGTPGHYYVDEKTAPLVNRVIRVNGKQKILRADKNGRLYYDKVGQNRSGREINRQREAAAQAAQAAQTAAPAAQVDSYVVANDFINFSSASG